MRCNRLSWPWPWPKLQVFLFVLNVAFLIFSLQWSRALPLVGWVRRPGFVCLFRQGANQKGRFGSTRRANFLLLLTPLSLCPPLLHLYMQQHIMSNVNTSRHYYSDQHTRSAGRLWSCNSDRTESAVLTGQKKCFYNEVPWPHSWANKETAATLKA